MKLDGDDDYDRGDSMRPVSGIGMGCILGVFVFVVFAVIALIWLLVAAHT